MTDPKPETSSKISNPLRISRIVAKMCQGRMQALIRTKDNSKLGMRAAFVHLEAGREAFITFDRISEFALEKLAVGMSIKVEVIGMPSKVMFVTEVRSKSSGTIVCPLPLSLVSIERRQNSRFRATSSSMAYMSFSVWQPKEAEVASPPFFESYRNLAGWLSIVDISAGGLCIQSHFPSFINQLETIDFDPAAQLHLPMSAPLTIGTAIRWRRRIKNRILEESLERYQLDFRVGIEFADLSEDNKMRIRQYMRQLSMADAI